MAGRGAVSQKEEEAARSTYPALCFLRRHISTPKLIRGSGVTLGCTPEPPSGRKMPGRNHWSQVPLTGGKTQGWRFLYGGDHTPDTKTSPKVLVLRSRWRGGDTPGRKWQKAKREQPSLIPEGASGTVGFCLARDGYILPCCRPPPPRLGRCVQDRSGGFDLFFLPPSRPPIPSPSKAGALLRPVPSAEPRAGRNAASCGKGRGDFSPAGKKLCPQTR